MKSWWNDILPKGKLSYYIYYKDIDVAVCMQDFNHTKRIKLTVIITYYYDFFESFLLERVSCHQLLTTYYRNIGVAVSIKDFHQVKHVIR